MPLIVGREFNDYLVGTNDADVLQGLAGNDQLEGRGGSDRLEGGEGMDTARFLGLSRGYQITQDRVSSGVEGGVDTLVSIEQLRFVDGHMSFDNYSQVAIVYRMYDAAFGRAPDAEGFGTHMYFLARSPVYFAYTLALAFVQSAEFQARFGNLSNRAFVETLYRVALGREGDPEGIAAWTAQLDSNRPGTTRSNVLTEFAESPENIAQTTAAVRAGIWAPDVVTGALVRLYDTVLDRLPDQAGLIALRASIDRGATLLDATATLMASAEFVSRYGALGPQAFVEQLYRLSLNREGDAAGVAAWTAVLQGGASRASVVLAFSESIEHRALTARSWEAGVHYLDSEAQSVLGIDPSAAWADPVFDISYEPEDLSAPIVVDLLWQADSSSAAETDGWIAEDLFMARATTDWI